MTPFYSDFSRITSTRSNSFGGITGGSSSSPGAGVVDYVSLDNDGRVCIYSDHDVMYSPSAMIRMYASEPARQKGHHVCTKRLVQERADGVVGRHLLHLPLSTRLGLDEISLSLGVPSKPFFGPFGAPGTPRGPLCSPATSPKFSKRCPCGARLAPATGGASSQAPGAATRAMQGPARTPPQPPPPPPRRLKSRKGPPQNGAAKRSSLIGLVLRIH
jgi:hypothetical protein